VAIHNAISKNHHRSGITLISRIDRLFIVLHPAQEYFTYMDGDVTIIGEGLQNLGLCSALRAFEQGGIFIVTHLL
jgi:hypothetical protein